MNLRGISFTIFVVLCSATSCATVLGHSRVTHGGSTEVTSADLGGMIIVPVGENIIFPGGSTNLSSSDRKVLADYSGCGPVWPSPCYMPVGTSIASYYAIAPGSVVLIALPDPPVLPHAGTVTIEVRAHT